MNSTSETHNRHFRLTPVFRAACLAAMVVFAATACDDPDEDTGFKFPHDKHVVENEMTCDMCHGDMAGEPVQSGHDVCGTCHEVEDFGESGEPCAFCHRSLEITEITPVRPASYADVIFKHAPHAAAGVACNVCHANIEKSQSVEKDQTLPHMPVCMDCHVQKGAPTECSACHSVIDENYTPTVFNGRNVDHSNKAFWMKRHGAEYQVEPDYCQTCHVEQDFCISCHQDTPPADHNNAWRNRTHGMSASWDRERCATCHEEDFCVRCHATTEPKSHKAGWAGGMNRHCVNCHLPLDNNQCGVCHNSAEHESAGASPHPPFGPPSAECNECHPAGRPGIAPHLTGVTTDCLTCHVR